MKTRKEVFQTEHLLITVTIEELTQADFRTGSARPPENQVLIATREGHAPPVRLDRAEADLLAYVLRRYCGEMPPYPVYMPPPPPMPFPTGSA